MIAINYSTLRKKLKDYCDKVTDEFETVVITRKDEKNVVLISLDEWNAMMKALRNSEYLDKIDNSFAQVEQGKTITKSLEELEEITNE